MPSTDIINPSSFIFALTVYREAAQLEWCLARVRSVYPTTPIVVISDGDDDPRYGSLAKEFGAEYVPGSRAKVVGKGAEYWARFFDLFLKTDAQHLLKIDPDTALHRRFKFFPGADFFGTWLEKGTDFEHIQGGCQVFSRDIVERGSRDGMFRDDRYRRLEDWCQSPRLLENLRAFSASGILNADFMVYDMMKRLGARITNWEESHCQWKADALKRNWFRRYAITHPHKIAKPGAQMGRTERLAGRSKRD